MSHDLSTSQTTSFPTLCFQLMVNPIHPEPPAPGTYVVKVPKDVVYRVPPPENSRRYDHYTRRNNRRRRSFCRRCLFWLICLIFTFIVLFGLAAGVLYAVFRPKAPKYTVDRIAFTGINLTSPAGISPELNVSVRANNPNGKIGFYYYEKESSVEVYYNDDGVMLSNGVMPAFYQPPKNVTVFVTALKGSDVVLTTTERTALEDDVAKGKVLLKMKLTAPVKIKVGSVKTWKITVKVNCDVTVDKLTEEAGIVSKACDYSVGLW